MARLDAGNSSALKTLGSVGTLGLEMAAYLLIFTKGGQWLDSRFDIAPILERVGVGIGIFAGFYTIWKRTRSPRAEATPELDREGGAPGVTDPGVEPPRNGDDPNTSLESS